VDGAAQGLDISPANSEAGEMEVIPGGFQIGDRVFYCGGKQTFASGNKLAFALEGEVIGQSTPPDERRLKILFVGNPNPMDVIVTQVSSTVPIIPGAYKVGDRVYFCGETQNFSNGDKLQWGLQGEIVGRSTFGDGSDERRVKVLMDENKGSCTVFLSQVQRDAPTLPGGFEPGDRVIYTKPKKETFKNGDQLKEGLVGTVAGRSNMGDGTDDRRLKIRFDGNKGPINIFITEIIKEKQDDEPAKAQAQVKFEVGMRCEAFYEDEWFVGTIRAAPDADKEKLGRWAVQCDVDEEGLFTFASEIRPLKTNPKGKAKAKAAAGRAGG
jgi:hypothetical protein